MFLINNSDASTDKETIVFNMRDNTIFYPIKVLFKIQKLLYIFYL